MITTRNRLARWAERLALIAMLSVGALALTLLAVTVGGALQGFRAVAMDTGSMAPVITPGDLVLIQRVPASAVRPGDVITFQAPIDERPTVTHRVASVTTAAGRITFSTKGDSNGSVDPWTIHYQSGQAWRMVRVLPGVGTVIAFLGGIGGRLAVGALSFAVCLGILSLGGRRPDPALPRSPETAR
jgi:signal peptidase